MKENIIKDINLRVNDFTYLEFSIISFDKSSLTIAGSQDLLYYRDIEIVFSNVFTIICNSSWKVDTSKIFISIVEGTEESYELNSKYGVEVGNTIFKLTSEDGITFYIIAEDILFKNI